MHRNILYTSLLVALQAVSGCAGSTVVTKTPDNIKEISYKGQTLLCAQGLGDTEKAAADTARKELTDFLGKTEDGTLRIRPMEPGFRAFYCVDKSEEKKPEPYTPKPAEKPAEPKQGEPIRPIAPTLDEALPAEVTPILPKYESTPKIEDDPYVLNSDPLQDFDIESRKPRGVQGEAAIIEPLQLPIGSRPAIVFDPLEAKERKIVVPDALKNTPKKKISKTVCVVRGTEKSAMNTLSRRATCNGIIKFRDKPTTEKVSKGVKMCADIALKQLKCARKERRKR